MNIYRYELKNNFKSALVWGIAMALVGWLFLSIYPAFSADMELFNKILASYPPAVLKAFGASLDYINSFAGFYSFCFVYIIVCAAIQAMLLSTSLIGKEAAKKMTDFLFTKGISRTQILSQKVLAGLTCLVVTNVIYFIVVYSIALFMNADLNSSTLFLLNFSMFLIQFLFFALGFLITCLSKKIKSPITISGSVVSLFFMIEMLVNMEPDGSLKYISFLTYLSGETILKTGFYDPLMLGLLIVVTLVMMATGFAIFQRKDLASQ